MDTIEALVIVTVAHPCTTLQYTTATNTGAFLSEKKEGVKKKKKEKKKGHKQDTLFVLLRCLGGDHVTFGGIKHFLSAALSPPNPGLQYGFCCHRVLKDLSHFDPV